MARSKKVPLIEDFNSIPEEALVPVEEQPYEIPSHWKWVRLGSVARVVKNKTECFKETRPYVGLEHLAPGGGLVSFGDTTGVKSAKTVFSRGHVLYGRLRPYLDKHWIAEFDGVCSTDILVFNTQPLISRVYFHFWLGTPLFQQSATQNAKGINLPRVSEHVLASFPIPLPPIEEQVLIVKKLESNLARIDDVIGRCQTALEDIDDQTNGLLQAAVNGELTFGWRQTQSLSHSDWVEVSLEELGCWGGGGTPKKSVSAFWEGGTIPWITPKDMKSAVLAEPQNHITELGIAESPARKYLGPALCIVVRSGILRRTLPVAYIEGEFTVNQDMKVLHSLRDGINPIFLLHFFVANEALILEECSKSGTTVESIDFEKLRAFTLNLPPKVEQDEIVRLIDSRQTSLVGAQKQVRRAEELLGQMKSSILAAGLSGRL